MEYQLTDVVLELTRACNLRCIHCASSCETKMKGELDCKKWQNGLDQISRMKVKRIVFSGGEPTLKPGFDRLISYCGELNLRYGFISNGFCLPEKIKYALKTNKPFAVGISVDGFKETHNKIRQNTESWSNLLHTISYLQDLGIDVCISTTVNRLNYIDLPLLAKFFNLAEIASWQIIVAMPAGRMASQKEFLLDEKRFKSVCRYIMTIRQQYPDMNIQAADCFGPAQGGLLRPHDWATCSAGISTLGIDAWGNVMPCLSLRCGITAGNLVEKDLGEIWETSTVFDFNRKFDPASVVEGSCINCELLSRCHGGCASQSMAFNDRLHDAPFCFARSFGNEKAFTEGENHE